MKNKEIKETKSGFFPLADRIQKTCLHIEHNPPSHMVIPHHMGYKHICTACKKVSIVIPRQVTL